MSAEQRLPEAHRPVTGEDIKAAIAEAAEAAPGPVSVFRPGNEHTVVRIAKRESVPRAE